MAISDTRERVLRLALPYQQVHVTLRDVDSGQTMLSLQQVRCINLIDPINLTC